MAKKKKATKTNVDRILDKEKINYHAYEIPWSDDHFVPNPVAAELGIPQAVIYKTIVIKGDKTGPIVAVLPGNESLNLKNLAKVSGNKRVELLDLKLLEQTTGYIRGGCSPIGMRKLLPTFLAVEAQELPEILVSAGKRGVQVGLNPFDLQRIVQGEFVEIVQQNESAE